MIKQELGVAEKDETKAQGNRSGNKMPTKMTLEHKLGSMWLTKASQKLGSELSRSQWKRENSIKK